MCLYPELIRNPKYKMTAKNGGIVPVIPDGRVKWVAIGCTQCIECRRQKARAWQARLLEDIKHNKNGKFVTFTFNNNSYKELDKEIDKRVEGHDRDNAIATLAMRRFLERWRKEHKKSIRHWLVTELGHEGTENVHIHGIIWTDHSLDKVEAVWKYGFMWKGKVINDKVINYVNEKTVNYIVKYVHKVDEMYKTYKSLVLTSAGIGCNYVNTYDSKLNKYNEEGETNELYRNRQGFKMNMPIYWRNKIYSEHEREQLWLKKLDKNVMYVRGEKIDISENRDEYYRALEYHRRINERLGYGTSEKKWEQVQYEKERRMIKQAERIAKAEAKENKKNNNNKKAA